MEQTRIDIEHLSRLSRLEANEEDRLDLESRLVDILEWVGKLNEVDTEGIAPMTSASFEDLPRRDDVVTDGGDVETVLGNASDRLMDYYVVPKVVE